MLAHSQVSRNFSTYGQNFGCEDQSELTAYFQSMRRMVFINHCSVINDLWDCTKLFGLFRMLKTVLEKLTK